MKKSLILISFLLISTIFFSCQAEEPIVEATATTEPTAAVEPTVIPSPTFTPTTEPTATPIGQVFRDDFTESLQPGWIWLNENPANWEITEEGWFRIESEDLALLGDHYQNNLLMINVPADINFRVDAHVNAATTSNFQQASIFLFEDEDNYFSVNRGYCDLCSPKGSGIYSDYMFKGEMSFSFKGRAIDTDDVYLRITVNRETKTLIAYYAVEPDQWIQLRRIPLLYDINLVGLGSANSDNGTFDDNLIALFDYFEISILE